MNPEIRRSAPISFGIGISVGSKKPINVLIVKDKTMNKDGKSTFDKMFFGYILYPFPHQL